MSAMRAEARHGTLVNVPSKGRWSELFWSLIWKVAHPVSDHTQPCLTSIKQMKLAGPIGHSPLFHSQVLKKSFNVELLSGPPREFRGLGAKEKDEASCEQSEQQIVRVQKLTLEDYCWFTL